MNHEVGDDKKIDDKTLQYILGILYAVWLVSGILFLSVIKKSYYHTFYSFDTTSAFNRRIVINLRPDQKDTKHIIFFDHQDTYTSWGGEHLRPWTLKNWDKWEEEKPLWFTDAWVDHVPNGYIPYKWRVKYKKTKGRVDDDAERQRRRSSLLGGVKAQ